jgi:serine/threonine protein kinase
MDWGIVKVGSRQSVVDSHSRQSESTVAVGSQTDEGTVIGTKGFMAPEQARGAIDEIDQRADVYSLGAILYLLLTDDVPASDGDLPGNLHRARIPRALAAICGRALTIELTGRYQTVAALADDVARYRAGRAVGAYRETTVERVIRFSRAYQTAILLVLAYIIMRVVVAFVAGW